MAFHANPPLPDLPNHTYEVGTKDFNISPFQIYDMLYNVYEWVGEPYGILGAGNKLLRGARFGTPYDLEVLLYLFQPDKFHSLSRLFLVQDLDLFDNISSNSIV